MRRLRHKGVVSLLCLAVLLPPMRAVALEHPTPRRNHTIPARGLLLDLATRIHRTSLDCSHLVHYLYSRVGLHYTYAESRRLYKGIRGFVRVHHPKAGDLVVWRGHVGIVVDPEQRSFVSALRTGVKVAQYDSSYWKSRGKPRFFRYAGLIENSDPGQSWAASQDDPDSYVTMGMRASENR